MRMLDLFSGIGGFHKGFEQAGFTFTWVGYSEIDKYAAMVYQEKFPDAKALGDITAIQPRRDLPSNIDILCGGFPCQAFSIAGRRKGFDDTRGTLFFDIARILRYYRENGKPIRYFVLENVKGLLGHDNGRTFATIYRVLADLGYTVECQLLNTRWVLPQNRERIYIVGHLGNGSRSKVFPIGESNKIINEWKTKVASTLQHPGHLGGNYRGMNLIQVETLNRKQDSYDFNSRVYSDQGIAKTLAGEGGNNDNKTGLYKLDNKVRRLTPKECERLQGFPDDWTAYADGQKISDTQRYKMCGNAVSVPVVELVAKKIRSLHG
jgi:DNA (cytosine-5)-methyltransferase 1